MTSTLLLVLGVSLTLPDAIFSIETPGSPGSVLTTQCSLVPLSIPRGGWTHARRRGSSRKQVRRRQSPVQRFAFMVRAFFHSLFDPFYGIDHNDTTVDLEEESYQSPQPRGRPPPRRPSRPSRGKLPRVSPVPPHSPCPPLTLACAPPGTHNSRLSRARLRLARDRATGGRPICHCFGLVRRLRRSSLYISASRCPFCH